ncbi:hypothetical protein BS50DRAFT_537712 [Corynespora cassiicola Philippines]|uniref:BTB domain-containing protein n=1 Tax=Corynespora cassiicola Philippines TaxID=1448308 RepID=A0A2T2N1C6_CORCC|nr:hypothetical protein BS50DRAFT_537712 [Corynespora cassiicola Philippines]
MALKFEDFIQSHQFTFFIGDEGKPIVVHAAAIAATSPQLNALINGGMEESQKLCAKIEDVQVEDFIRFCEYAYRGDYTTPSWEELEPETSSLSRNNESDEDNGWGEWSTSSSKKYKKKSKKVRAPSAVWEESTAASEAVPVTEYPAEAESPSELKVGQNLRTQLRTQFNSRNYLSDSGPKAQILQGFEPKPNSSMEQGFTPVFLAHARLYCFAHKRLIEPLKALALHKLHKTLMDFKLYTKRIVDIIELAKYVYGNADLPDRSEDGRLDDLRELVVEYVVCEIDTIGSCDEFVKYVKEGGEFVGDFWIMTRKYFS